MEIFETKSETWVLTEAEVLELFAFLISSARTQLDDPANYGAMRLLTAFEELRDAVIERVSEETRAVLEKTLDKTADAHINMLDTDYYTQAIDDLNRMMAQYLVEQSGLGGKS
jgi:hypothetical protein